MLPNREQANCRAGCFTLNAPLHNSAKHLHHEIVLDLQTPVARLRSEQMAAIGQDFADDGRAAVLMETESANETYIMFREWNENSRKPQSSSQ
jgi:hypothetical protein